ncbi:MAG TPA: hypothetical protein VNJ08_17220 [Bacteriovoracaceae bacterium]|nr:hypothetical protein [Bacteriovoracaceae bacterium]
MVIVDNRDFVKKALEEHELNLFDFHDSIQVYTVEAFSKLPLTRRMDVLLIDTQSVLENPKSFEACKVIINTFQGTYFFHEDSNQPAQKWVYDQASFLTKIVGACSLPMPEMNWTLLANQLQFFWTMLQEHKTLQKHMAEFSQELDQVLQTAQTEMARAKKIHETLIPKRNDEIKGISFLNKYATGDGGGAEFSDLHQTPNKAFQIFVASESYLISSSILGILNDHKTKDFDPVKFLADANADVAAINGSKKKKAHVDLLVLEMDLSHLNLKAHGQHKAEFHSQLNGKLDLDANKEYKLAKGEKFIVFSPGFLFNWKESDHKQDIHSFVKGHQELSLQELMTELFFQIRKDQGNQFLKKDATIVMMEVNRHGMHQV